MSRFTEELKLLSLLPQVGLSFVACICIGTAAGYWLDRQLGTRTIATLIGCFLGMCAGLWVSYKLLFSTKGKNARTENRNEE
ncbi:MAG: AtpZ/AtpI family protein [Candidatus Cloacimonetes bacterium]|nr:AtpZ/AtpI family protein [Candidatus Cloacimonadota bacterium]